jgi:hypothetical protein
MQALYVTSSTGIDDAEAALECYQGDYAGTLDHLEAWAENLLKQKGELEAILTRYPGTCSTTQILKSMDAE